MAVALAAIPIVARLRLVGARTWAERLGFHRCEMS
jgi:hypothetical protein